MIVQDDDLEVVAREARQRGLSLGRMIGELVAEKAQELRHGRRPRLGTFSSDVSIVAGMEGEDPAARSFRA